MQIKCDRCDGTFSRKSSLDRHRKNFHGASTGNFRCQQCLKTFSRRDILGRHERLHRGEGLTPCWMCSRLVRSDYLRKHINACLKKATFYFWRSDDIPAIYAIQAGSIREESGHNTQIQLEWSPVLTRSVEQRRPLTVRRKLSSPQRRVEQPVRVVMETNYESGILHICQ